MLPSISETAALNIGFWCAVWGLGSCVVLFLAEKIFKEFKISGRVYATIIAGTVVIAVASMLWAGRDVKAGKTKHYDKPEITAPVSKEKISQQNDAIQEKIDKKYEDYSQKKEKELRKESDNFFDQLMEQENKQRQKAGKNKEQK